MGVKTMNPFALVSFISFLVILFFGIYIYSKNHKEILNITFLMICLIEAYNSFTEFQIRQAHTYFTADLWLKLSSFWPLEIPIIFHFILVFTENTKITKHKLFYFFNYIPSLIFSLLFFTNVVVLKPVKVYWGWSYTVYNNPLLLYLIVVWLLCLSLLTMYLCFRFYLKTTNYIKKRQSLFVFIGITTPFVEFMIIDFYFNINRPVVPEFTSVAFIVESGFIGYAIWKYELFKITLQNAVDKILSTMTDVLILIDNENRISAVNQAALKLLSYEENEIIGQPFTVLIGEQEIALNNELYFENLRTKGSISDMETTFKPQKGKIIPVSLSASVLTDNKGRHAGVVLFGRDITNRKLLEDELIKARDELEIRVQERTSELAKTNTELYNEIMERSKAEEQLQLSLEEKDVLLKEVHHRVKNNMQVIISLLKLQAGYIKDEVYQNIFDDIINRIHSMALVHFLLYKSDNFSNIYFQDYIQKLCEYLIKIYKVDLRKIEIAHDIHIEDLKIDIAIPCGLIINELVSNSIKHAFTDTGTGKIVISMKENRRRKIKLIVSDNGSGIPEDLDWRKSDSFGLQILSYLAEGQLQGKVKLDRASGTEFVITFSR